MAKLTKERGSKIREEHSGILEKQICDNHNLQQIGEVEQKLMVLMELQIKVLKMLVGLAHRYI